MASTDVTPSKTPSANRRAPSLLAPLQRASLGPSFMSMLSICTYPVKSCLICHRWLTVLERVSRGKPLLDSMSTLRSIRGARAVNPCPRRTSSRAHDSTLAACAVFPMHSLFSNFRRSRSETVRLIPVRCCHARSDPSAEPEALHLLVPQRGLIATGQGQSGTSRDLIPSIASSAARRKCTVGSVKLLQPPGLSLRDCQTL